MIADLHIHSNHSVDGRSSVADILDTARERGLGCIAICDHNVISAHAEVPEDSDIIVVPAVEVSSAEGHIIAYGVREEIPRDMGIQETIDAIHAAGGLACAAHPYRFWSGIGGDNLDDRFDMVEGWNSRSTRKGNKRAMDSAAALGMPMTGGSDSHDLSSIGDAWTRLTVPCKDWEEVLQAVMDGHVELGGTHRNRLATIRYVLKAVGEWIARGFRRM